MQKVIQNRNLKRNNQRLTRLCLHVSGHGDDRGPAGELVRVQVAERPVPDPLWLGAPGLEGVGHVVVVQPGLERPEVAVAAPGVGVELDAVDGCRGEKRITSSARYSFCRFSRRKLILGTLAQNSF